jgi:hypothetical protein
MKLHFITIEALKARRRSIGRQGRELDQVVVLLIIIIR